MQKLIFYGSQFCPQVYIVRRELDRNGIKYEYIDIHKDADAAKRVREINNGYESVPTLVFPDASTLTEPSTADLLSKLREYDETIQSSGSEGVLSLLLQGPNLRLIAALLVLIGIISDIQVITWIGLGFLGVSFLLLFMRRQG